MIHQMHMRTTGKARLEVRLSVLLLALSFALALYALFLPFAHAQQGIATTSIVSTSTTQRATSTQEASSTIDIGGIQFEKTDLTRPEEIQDRQEILNLLDQRPIERPTYFNLLGYWVQEAIKVGIPANTIVLILLIPILATIVTFVRSIVGLPSLEMLVPIILAFAFVAVGITIGLIILAAIIVAAFVSRKLLKQAPIMFYPKRTLSLLLLSFFVFGALTAAIGLDIERVKELSIFPVLILTLLGDSLVSVQLHKSMRETVLITTVTIVLGLIGYTLATMVLVRDLLVLYPEMVLLTIPINIIMGRYFGLRLSELFRFRAFQTYGSE